MKKSFLLKRRDGAESSVRSAMFIERRGWWVPSSVGAACRGLGWAVGVRGAGPLPAPPCRAWRGDSSVGTINMALLTELALCHLKMRVRCGEDGRTLVQPHLAAVLSRCARTVRLANALVILSLCLLAGPARAAIVYETPGEF